MLSLAYELEREIIINGVAYQIDLSFDVVLRVFDLLRDDELNDADKYITAIQMFLDDVPTCEPEELVATFNAIMNELVYPKTIQPKLDLAGKPLKTDSKKANYSLVHDADYIYASFWQAYGIDLLAVRGQLDWAKFNALLNGLPDDTKFKQVIEIRERPFAKGKGVQKENEALRNLKQVYALPREGGE